MSDRGHQRYRIAPDRTPSGPATSPCGVRRTPSLVVSACWLYAGAVMVIWAITRWSPPESWPVHLILYGPRWVLALPLLPLIFLAARRRSWWSSPPLGIAAAAFVAFWGFVQPGWRLASDDAPSKPFLRILTCNVQYGDLRVEALAELVQENRPDLVLLQECRLANPGAILSRQGWHVRTEGEFFMASRFPIVGFSVLRRPDKAYRVIAARAEVSWSGQTISVVSAHLMTPRKGLEAIIKSPVRGFGTFREVAAVQHLESGLLRQWVADAPGSILMAGDFNLTVEHPLYRRDWSGYTNAFSATGWGLGQTMSTRRIGLRIDHILDGPKWRPDRCWVGPDVGSAHRPLLAEMTWIGPPDDPSD